MSRERPRLLVLTSTFPRRAGDATPGFVAELSGRLCEEFDVTVLTPAVPGAPTEERWGALRVRRFRYGWPATSQRLADGAILPNLRQDPRLWAQVPPFIGAQIVAAWSLARRERFDAVHAHWVVPAGIVALILRITLGTPYLVTGHGADLYALRGGAFDRIKRQVLARASRITAVSGSLRDEMARLGAVAEEIAVVPMGVDTGRFRPDRATPEARALLNPDGPALLFVGRLAEKKGTRYAIEAMPALLRAHATARLAVVGDGPEREALVALVARRGLEPYVRFLGAVDHEALPALYASADMVLAPSVRARDGDTESFGLVIAEAMASGSPVVASDVGGIGDLVEHGGSGLLVPERDPGAIATAVDRVLSDPGLRDRIREGALQRASQVDSGRVAERYRTLLLEAVVS